MCNAALNTFGLLNSEDKVNYNYFACKESCWISGDDIFDNVFYFIFYILSVKHVIITVYISMQST